MKRALLISAVALLLWAPPLFAQTATPADTGTPTLTGTPTITPTPAGLPPGDSIRGLNSSVTAGRVKLGERLYALWNDRHTGGTLSVGSDATKLDIAAGHYVIDGVQITGAAGNEVILPTTVLNTTAAQYRKVTVVINLAGDYSFIAGATAATQAAAIKPFHGGQRTEVGYIELPPSFTAGSTSLTAEMLKQAPTRASVLGPWPN